MNKFRSESIFYNVSLWSPVSKEYLARNITSNGVELLNVKKIERNRKYLTITDNRDISSDYELQYSLSNLSYYILEVAILITILIFVLKRK